MCVRDRSIGLMGDISDFFVLMNVGGVSMEFCEFQKFVKI